VEKSELKTIWNKINEQEGALRYLFIFLFIVGLGLMMLLQMTAPADTSKTVDPAKPSQPNGREEVKQQHGQIR